MIEVELPDGTIAEFPDGMPPADIEKALAQQFGAAPEAPESVDQGGSVANPFVQGATFGFGDEGIALVSAAIGKMLPESMGGLPDGVTFADAFEGIRQEINADTQAFEERNPATAAVAEIGGGFVSGGAGVAKAVGTLARGRGIVAKGATGAATGAAEGGLFGAGLAQPGERREGAARGATVGALTGGLGTVAFSKASDAIAGRAIKAREIKAGSASKELAKFKLSPKGKIQSDRAAKQAISQGFGEGLIQQIKTSTPEDKRAYLEMVRIAKESMKDNRFAANNRVNSVIGDALADRVNKLNTLKDQAGQKVDDAAKSLKNKFVDYEPAINQFIADLEGMGVKVNTQGRISVNLKGSDIEGATEAEAIINRVFDRLANTDVPKSAYDVHRAKRFLDTQGLYGKSAEKGLKGQALNVVKQLRRNLDGALDGKFSDYDAANTQYSDTIGALEFLQDSMGRNVNMFNKSAPKQLGIQSRKLLSNYASGVNQHDAILNAEQVLAKYNQKVTGNIMDLVSVESALRGVVPQNLFNTFQGDIQKAVTPGRVMRGAAGDKFALGEIVGEFVRKSKGVTPETALESLEALIQDSL